MRPWASRSECWAAHSSSRTMSIWGLAPIALLGDITGLRCAPEARQARDCHDWA